MIEEYCTTDDLRALLTTPPLPLQTCRVCWRCSPEFKTYTGEIVIGCCGKGVRSRDGREGQFCTIFKPRWKRTAADIEEAQRCAYPMVGPDGW